MNGMEWNKIMAALLVAGIVASLSGFIAKETVHAHALHEDAVPVEASAGGGATAAAAQAGPEPILAMIAAADITRGEKISKACTACHSFNKGGADGAGPNLWGVVGRAKGSHGGFAYSDGMKAKGGNWGYDELNHFLWKPKAFVDGTKMNFIGLKKPEDRASLIAWLRTLSDGPAALPSESAIAAEQAAMATEQAETPEETVSH